MATISITYPDSAQTRIVDALCYDGGWAVELGITRGAFAKKMVAEMVRERVLATETRMAQEAAVRAVVPPEVIPVT